MLVNCEDERVRERVHVRVCVCVCVCVSRSVHHQELRENRLWCACLCACMCVRSFVCVRLCACVRMRSWACVFVTRLIIADRRVEPVGGHALLIYHVKLGARPPERERERERGDHVKFGDRSLLEGDLRF